MSTEREKKNTSRSGVRGIERARKANIFSFFCSRAISRFSLARHTPDAGIAWWKRIFKLKYTRCNTFLMRTIIKGAQKVLAGRFILFSFATDLFNINWRLWWKLNFHIVLENILRSLNTFLPNFISFKKERWCFAKGFWSSDCKWNIFSKSERLFFFSFKISRLYTLQNEEAWSYKRGRRSHSMSASPSILKSR